MISLKDVKNHYLLHAHFLVLLGLLYLTAAVQNWGLNFIFALLGVTVVQTLLIKKTKIGKLNVFQKLDVLAPHKYPVWIWGPVFLAAIFGFLLTIKSWTGVADIFTVLGMTFLAMGALTYLYIFVFIKPETNQT